jgi:predicted glycosyltransferase
VRRNVLLARSVLAADPSADVTVITGVAVRPRWLEGDDRLRVVSVPPLVKDDHGAYRNASMPYDDAVRARAAVVADVLVDQRPDVVVVDRHPYGTGGELAPALDLARSRGARLVLGLRDVIDEPVVVREELASQRWDGVAGLFHEILVYGSPLLCDHEAEYGLPMQPTYCGWVGEAAPVVRREHDLLTVCAGGGGDGAAVLRLGIALAAATPDRRVVVVPGPYGRQMDHLLAGLPDGARDRISVRSDGDSTLALAARSSALLQMAGYNSTVEALAAGLRPVLVPRRTPRREQAIRAGRLAALGLADVIDDEADPAELAWLLRRRRTLAPSALHRAGIRLDGAHVAARRIVGSAKAVAA